jgi:phosphoserine aminotransferase
MTTTVYNFSAGPAMLPPLVLERAREEMRSVGGQGVSIMEISHRSPEFEAVRRSAENGLRDLMGLGEEHEVLFFQGGATLQFSMIPMNLLGPGEFADHIVTGAWSEKAVKEAERYGDARVIYSSKKGGFRSIPQPDELKIDPKAAYVHYTSNETIDGVEFKYDLDGGGVPVICDASSNILSKPFDMEKYAMVYAGAQKNIGPSGVTVVVIRKDLLERIPSGLTPVMDYRRSAAEHSMVNTPNTWGIYLISLVCDWLKDQGGTEAMARRNEEKAAILYKAIDGSDGFYSGHAEPAARSLMNVTFRLPSPELEELFIGEAEREGMLGLRGHRTVGGIRASIYNAFPREGVEALAALMGDFISRRG